MDSMKMETIGRIYSLLVCYIDCMPRMSDNICFSFAIISGCWFFALVRCFRMRISNENAIHYNKYTQSAYVKLLPNLDIITSWMWIFVFRLIWLVVWALLSSIFLHIISYHTLWNLCTYGVITWSKENFQFYWHIAFDTSTIYLYLHSNKALHK